MIEQNTKWTLEMKQTPHLQSHMTAQTTVPEHSDCTVLYLSAFWIFHIVAVENVNNVLYRTMDVSGSTPGRKGIWIRGS